MWIGTENDLRHLFAGWSVCGQLWVSTLRGGFLPNMYIQAFLLSSGLLASPTCAVCSVFTTALLQAHGTQEAPAFPAHLRSSLHFCLNYFQVAPGPAGPVLPMICPDSPASWSSVSFTGSCNPAVCCPLLSRTRLATAA